MGDKNNHQDLDYYHHASAKGIRWGGVTEALTRFTQFITTILLARLLVPHDFGEIALALIFIQFIQLVIDIGITSALVQRQDLTRNHYNTAFTFLLVYSVIMGTFTFWNAGFISNVLGNSSIAPLIKFLSILIPLNAINLLPRVYITRRLYYRKLALVDFLGSLTYGGITVLIAWKTRSVWCFVAGLIAEQMVISAILWSFSRWKPALRFDLHILKDLLSYGGVVFGTRIFNFLSLNVPQIFIQRFFGSAALGYFSIALQLVEIPIQRIAKNIMKVMFPILSRVHTIRKDFQILFFDAIYLMILITLPIYIILFIFAEPLVLLLYGDKWQLAIPLIKIMTVLGIARSLWTGISLATLSMGKPDIEFRFTLLNFLLLVPIIFLLRPDGLHAVVSGFSVLWFTMLILGGWAVFNQLALSWRRLFKLVKTPLMGGVMMLSIFFIFTILLPRSQNNILIIIHLFVLISFYILILFLMDKNLLLEKFRLFFQPQRYKAR